MLTGIMGFLVFLFVVGQLNDEPKGEALRDTAAPAATPTTTTPPPVAPPVATSSAPAAPSTTPPPPAATTVPVAPAPTSAAPAPSSAAPARAAGQLDRHLTPGHTFVDATRLRVCVSGYSSRVRNVSGSTRRDVFTAYGIAYPPPSGAFELDHLIPLELGGDNSRPNLWPEPYHGNGSADVKDHLENHLHALVCSGQVALSTAQRAIAGDWVAAAAQYNPLAVRSSPRPTQAPTTRQPTTRPPTTTPPPDGGGSTYYANCTAVRAAGADPIHVGEPGYSRKLDRDGDGVACE